MKVVLDAVEDISTGVSVPVIFQDTKYDYLAIEVNGKLAFVKGISLLLGLRAFGLFIDEPNRR